MFLSDYHVHSRFSKDSLSNLDDIVNKSKSLGLEEIAITDHLDYDVKDIEYNCSMDNFDDYHKTIEELQYKYNDYLKIKIGIELGMQMHLKERLESIVRNSSLDFVIYSLHSLNGHLISLKKNLENRDIDDIYNEYFITILNNIKNYNDYSVIGHLDFISRYCKKRIDYNKYSDIIDEIFKHLIYNGKGIEINTSGFKYQEDRFYPDSILLKKFIDMGGEIITIGSDSHNVKEICSNFKIVYDFLDRYSVKYICSFDKMNIKFVKIK